MTDWESLSGRDLDWALAPYAGWAENMYGATIAKAVARSLGEAHEHGAALA